MHVNLSLSDLALASAEHPWRTVGAWLTLLGAVIVLLDDTLTAETALTNNPDPV